MPTTRFVIDVSTQYVCLPCNKRCKTTVVCDRVWLQTGADVDGEVGSFVCWHCNASHRFIIVDDAARKYVLDNL